MTSTVDHDVSNSRLRRRQDAPRLGARRRGNRVPPQAGMALVESLVSLLIFSFGLLGLIGLEASAINLSVDAEDRDRAALFASEVASTMWVNGSITIPAATLTQWNSDIANPATTGLPNGVLRITPNAALINSAGTVNGADVVITWIPTTDKTQTTRTLSTRVILP